MQGSLVTATSSDHFPQAFGLIRSAQRHLPRTWNIVLYDLLGDLGAKNVGKVQGWCGVEYRRFDPSRTDKSWYPGYLTLSVWKPLIILDCLKALGPDGVVLYADTSTRLHQRLSDALLAAVRILGFVGRQTASPIALYTHPQMAVELFRQKPRNETTAGNLSTYLDAPMVCGCIGLWANTPFVLEHLLKPWASCTARPACILPAGADGQDNHIGLPKLCRPGLEGHCHRGDQSALSIILYEAFGARIHGPPVYLRNTSVGTESWKMGKVWMYGTHFTTERASGRSAEPLQTDDKDCVHSSVIRAEPVLQGILGQAESVGAVTDRPTRHASNHILPSSVHANCSTLVLTRVAVPTGIQPLFRYGSAPGSLQRLLRPCRTTEACNVGAEGCFITRRNGQPSAIGKCNATHGVEYEVRLPDDGEPAIVSFFNPSPKTVQDALKAIEKARPRLYFEFEPPVHARVPQAHVLEHVDGQMTYLRRALVHYPYFSPKQIWDFATRQPIRGFEERQAAIAVFVSNCRGHRAQAIEWLRTRFIVHSYGACQHSSSNNLPTSKRRQGIEGGYFPECLGYRAVLAIENNACEDYVSEKLLEAVRCGAVPIVRTVKGLPDYGKLFGPLPLLDAANLTNEFAVRLHAVLTHRKVWMSYLPSQSPGLTPSKALLTKLTRPNPHCQLIDAVTYYRNAVPVSSHLSPLTHVKCATFYHLSTPRGIQVLPRRLKAGNESINESGTSRLRPTTLVQINQEHINKPDGETSDSTTAVNVAFPSKTSGTKTQPLASAITQSEPSVHPVIVSLL